VIYEDNFIKNRWSWLIVGGCPRSGTTLLNGLFNTHPHVRLTNEISLNRLINHVKALFYKEQKFWQIPDRTKGRKETWNKESIFPFILQFNKCAMPVIQTLYEAHFADQVDISKVRYFGDKYPRYYDDNFEEVEKLLRSIKIIHISRNPLDVVNSMIRRSNNAQKGTDLWNFAHTVEDACSEWIRAWNFVNQRVGKRDGNLLHIKYEDLVFNTTDQLDEISDFLEVSRDFDQSLIIREHHYERDSLTSSDINKISVLIPGIIENWDNPLKQITQRFPQIPIMAAGTHEDKIKLQQANPRFRENVNRFMRKVLAFLR
jgi:hypothetical protein